MILPILFLGLILSNLLFSNSVQAQSATPIVPKSYYVDCNLGSDANTGLGINLAWKTVSKVNSVSLQPGDTLLFKRGCVWTGSSNGGFLILDSQGSASQPITVGAYGNGALPTFRNDARGNTTNPSTNQNTILITGNHLIVKDLKTVTINHGRDTTCTQDSGLPAKIGFYAGFTVQSDFVTLQNIESEDQSLGVFLQDSSSNNKVINAYVHDMDTFWRIYHPGKALGSIGVNLHGSDNEVSDSLFEQNNANCTDQTGEVHNYSAPFEVYNANRAYIHHNRAFGHRKHLEMGKDASLTSVDNVIAYNLFVSDKPDARGPNIHDAGNPFGPVERTQVYNNTIVFTGLGSQALIGSAGGIYKNNILIAEAKAAFYGTGTTQSNNIYWDFQKTTDSIPDPCIQFAPGGCTSTGASNPLLVNALVYPGDFHLSSNSPARHSGVAISTSSPLLAEILSRDLDGVEVTPTSIDIGAYKYAVTPIPGDANADQRVDSLDLNIWRTNYGISTVLGVEVADFNGDQVVNAIDYLVWRNNRT